jgi:hypothetical protein
MGGGEGRSWTDYCIDPPGTVHAFRNPTGEPAKLLITFISDGFAGFFDQGKELGSPMTDAAAWQQINERWDVQVVGPPLERERTATSWQQLPRT